MAIIERRDGREVPVYAGVDFATGRQGRISRQVRGSCRNAEREETRLKAQVMDSRHRGARVKTFAELVDTFLAQVGHLPGRVEHGRREPTPDEPLPAPWTDLNEELVEEALLAGRSRSRACRK